MRLFIGIPLSADALNTLSSVAAGFRSRADGLRWSAPESWHITLQFLGSTRPEQYACLVAHLRELRFRPIPVRIESLDSFDRAGVFFAGVAPEPGLLALQQRVSEATSHCGFITEERPYHPHITLARGKGKDGRHELRKLAATTQGQQLLSRFTASEFALYESLLSPTGSRYEIRERFALRLNTAV